MKSADGTFAKMSAKVRKSYTFDADVIAGAEEFADGSVSAFINAATKREVYRRKGLSFLAELDAERGRATDDREAVAWADAAWEKLENAARVRRQSERGRLATESSSQ